MAKILIVDDSESLRNHLRDILEASGYQVIQAEDGKKGHALYAATPDINLILADVNMPELDGIGMLKLIHEEKSRKVPPIIMLTTETNELQKATGKTLGVRAWINKPFVPDKLSLAIATLLARG